MNLQALFRGCPVLETSHWDPSRKIAKITSDSRSVAQGDVFVACRGERMDGHDFIGQSILAGATAVVYDRPLEFHLPKNVTGILVPNARQCLSLLLQHFYHAPDEKIKLVGITGTNGKTTVAYTLYRLLNRHVKSAYIGTLGYEYGENRSEGYNTTPGPEILMPLLSQMRHDGIQYCFIEVSSHALSQGRTNGLKFEQVVFTQLTQDHLDYHKTMERYFQAKRLLFSSSPKPSKMLINRDCEFGRRLLEEFLDASSYALERPADYHASIVDSSMAGSEFILKSRRREWNVKLALPMQHNVSNALAVLGALQELGFEPQLFLEDLAKFSGVPGRMEKVQIEAPFDVFVDYAHTPDAIERVLSGARALKPRRLLCLFGCGGDRDQDKRPKMAAAAAQYCDLIILTSDNPRSEDPVRILNDIKKGIPASSKDRLAVFEVPDRRQAIEKLLSLGEPGDAVFVLGKGHENYQILGDKKIPFDDRLVIQESLRRKARVLAP